MMRSLVTLSLLLSSITVFTVSCGSDELTGGDDTSKGGGGGKGGSSGLGGKAGGSTVAGRGGSAPTTSDLGSECGESTDCSGELQCLTALDLPGGLCTAGCASDGDCQAISSRSVCIPEGDGICFESCQSGGIGVKCHRREDLVCAPYSFVEGASCRQDSDCGENSLCSQNVCVSARTACLPSCGSDSDCGDGLFCDLESGSCAQERKTGLPIGSACSPGDEDDPCAGFCLRYGPGADDGFCSGLCRIGFESGLPGCGYDADSTSPEAACVFPSAFLDFEEGNSGFCFQLCDCDADCLAPGLACADWIPLAGGPMFGRRGLCLEESDDLDTIPQCEGRPDPGAGGAGGEGGESAVGGAGGAGPVTEGGSGGADESVEPSPDAGSGGTMG